MIVLDKNYQIGEPLYESQKISVYQGERIADGQRVIIKLIRSNYADLNEIFLFQNQFNLLKDLNVRGIVKVISFKSYKSDFAIVLEDFGLTSLHDYFSSLHAENLATVNIDRFLNIFLPIAIQLAEILGELDRHKILHKDIKPGNIQINPHTQIVKLTNFSYAERFLGRKTESVDETNRQIYPGGAFAGTLAYASPEQTGRMNRGIDDRSDFYSLGVTFYQLLTGKLPFDVEDPGELIYCHLAKLPMIVHKVNELIPTTLAAIVAKLMAKNAEDRYQNALCLQRDLEYCLYQWQVHHRIEPFELAKRAIDDRFNIPNKLYGRSVEVNIILNAFNRVIQGSKELILISGFFGVGKTAIFDRANRLISGRKGYFVRGEFIDPSVVKDRDLGSVARNKDPRIDRDIPFAVLIKAVRDSIGQLLSEDDLALAKHRENILAALGNDGQVIIDVIPELAQIIGEQPAVGFLFTNTRDRFSRLFQKLIEVLTQLDRPLVIFLDNLQWIDDDSLLLLERVMENTTRLCLICAYRDNELSGIHPLILTVNRLSKIGVTVDKIVLSSLSKSAVNELVADAFSCNVDSIQPLAELVHRKTNGNPFFVTKFLNSSVDRGLIKFNPQREAWQCDLSELKVQSLTNDEIDLMATQLQNLPSATQHILKLAACLGMDFDVPTLAIISQKSEREIGQILWAALEAGSIVPKQETCNFFQAITGIEPIEIDGKIVVAYQFTHDLVQQAAYSLIRSTERGAIHDRIGELLLESLVSEDLHSEARLSLAVNQLNCGMESLDLRGAEHRAKCDLLVQLNLMATRQARAAGNYAVAIEYARKGLKLLGDEKWQEEYQLTLTLHEIAIELAVLCGEFNLMTQWVNETIAHTYRPLDRVPVCIIQIQSLASQDLPEAAIDIARLLLAQFGVEFPVLPTLGDVEGAMAQIDCLLLERVCANESLARQIEVLEDLPMMTDPDKLAIMQVAASMLGACYAVHPRLYALVVALQVKLSIQYGYSPISAFSYAAYGIVINNYRYDVESANQFGAVAKTLVSRADTKEMLPETLAALGLFLEHRTGHLATTLPIFETGYQTALAAGKLEYVGHHLEGLFTTAFWCGEHLGELELKFLGYRQQLLDLDRLTTANYCDTHCETVLALLGNPDRISLAFDRVADDPKLLATNDLERVFLFYFHRAVLRFLLGDLDRATTDILRARGYLDGVAGLLCEVEFYFYDSLIALGDKTFSQGDLGLYLERVRTNQAQLRHWAKYAPMNHLHKWQLVEAETYRLFGDKAAAIEFYDLAIAGATAHNYIQITALAHELAAKLYLAWGKDRIAADYLHTAYDCYNQWGATAKIADLTSRYAYLLAEDRISPAIALQPLLAPFAGHLGESLQPVARGVESGDLEHSRIGENNSGDLYCSIIDFKTYSKAIQALYSEIDLDRLLKTLIDMVVENAGADRAALLLERDETLTVAIEYDEREIVPPPPDTDNHLPWFLIRHVYRTQTTQIHNGTDRPYPIDDPYFQFDRPQSILCLPILNQSKPIGVLYLENSLTNGAFTNERVKLLNVICTQAAISIENARLHQESQTYAQKLEQSLVDLQSSETRLLHVNEELIRSNRLKDRFLANMSHELRTPLNSILGMTSGLKERVFGTIASAQLTALETIEHSGTQLLALIDDVLELAKIEAGEFELNCTPTAIAPICQTSIAAIEQSALQKQLQIQTKIQANLPEINIDPRCIRQVLINLLNNAVKFTPPGGEIGLEVAYLDRATPELQENIRISITDTGIGISPENLDRLFQPFIQLDGALNRQFEGTGLGLALVKRIVDLHGGKVAANSQIGVGSTFTVDLPCAKITDVDIATISSAFDTISNHHEGASRSPLILLIEANEANINTISSYLQAKGYQIAVARDGEAGIELTKSMMPDLILMDMELPSMDGIVAIKLIREFSNVPIIALTAFESIDNAPDDKSIQARSLEVGANQFISKPIKLKQLTTLIQQQLI